MPHANKVIQELANDPIQFISITDEDPKRVEKFLSKRKLSGWVGVDTDRSAFGAYGVKGIPDTFVIDKGGKVVLRTRPEALTVEILRAIANGKYKAPAAVQPALVSSGKLPALGSFAPGLDPLWVPWIDAGQISEPKGGFYYQTTMRPSVGCLGSGFRSGRTGVGITLLNVTATEALAQALKVSAVRFVGAITPEKWDIIYSRPSGATLDSACQAVADLVCEVASVKLERVEREMDVLVGTTKGDSIQHKKDIDWETDPSVKSLRSVAALLDTFENMSGIVVVHGTDDLADQFIDTFGVNFWELQTAEKVRAWLEQEGVSFSPGKRVVELIQVTAK